MNNELEQNLRQFIGTQCYYRVYPDLLITEGINYLAEEAGCYWLVDLYWSHLKSIDQNQNPFTVLKLQVKDTAADIVIEDGNDNLLASQFVAYTDFPLASFVLYGCWTGSTWVVMLTSEY